MSRLSLVFGTHNHLPLGQDATETERVYQSSFKPLLAQLYGFPGFPAALHYSGLLLEWLEEHHPEFITLLGEMVRRGQVEVLGGGYYDPILPMIPTNDKLGQLEKMTTHLRVRFETRPRGCWLAECVWEPSLAFVLRASGIDYTFLDESQFRRAGAEGPQLLAPAIAEDQGKIVSVFPLASGSSPFAKDPAEVLQAMRPLACPAGDRVVTLLPDGSRSGPSAQWLEDFFGSALAAGDWLGPSPRARTCGTPRPPRSCTSRPRRPPR